MAGGKEKVDILEAREANKIAAGASVPKASELPPLPKSLAGSLAGRAEMAARMQGVNSLPFEFASQAERLAVEARVVANVANVEPAVSGLVANIYGKGERVSTASTSVSKAAVVTPVSDLSVTKTAARENAEQLKRESKLQDNGPSI